MTKPWPQFGNKAESYAAMEIPKHVWIDLYADLYRQCFGESETTDRAILADVLQRCEYIGRAEHGRNAGRVAARIAAKEQAA